MKNRKRFLLIALLTVFAVATLNAQVNGDMFGQLLRQMAFDYVPENEFNEVFQNFLKTNYPMKKIFSQYEIEVVTEAFGVYLYGNTAILNKWKKYADDKQPTQQAAQQAEKFNKSGREYYNKKDYDRAIADYTEAIRLDPKYATAYKYRGDAYYDKGDYDRAIADYTETIRLNPNHDSAYSWRGSAYNIKSDFDKAIADFTEAIRLKPDGYRYDSRGSAYLGKKDYDRAIADYDKAIQINSNSTGFYRRRGVAYMEKGDYAQARRDIEKALQIDPNNQTAMDNLAELQRRAGN
jgi:tetratricopeptide (TPR) repeat protein